MAIFIGIQGAFDAVWWPIVTNTLRAIGALKNVQEDITDREITLSHDGENMTRRMTKVCPQGSVLGISLLTIY